MYVVITELGVAFKIDHKLFFLQCTVRRMLCNDRKSPESLATIHCRCRVEGVEIKYFSLHLLPHENLVCCALSSSSATPRHFLYSNYL
jgi:hypothetical protein